VKTLIALEIAFACFAISAFGQYEGIYGYGIELEGNGAGAANSGIVTLYALNDGGATSLTPTGSSATLNQTSWDNGTALIPILNLGTFNPSAGDTLILSGGSMLTYQGGGDVVESNVVLEYAIDKIGAEGKWVGSDVLPLNQSGVAGASGNMRWSDETQSVNLLSGLAPGTYVLETYGLANSSIGVLYENNNVSNYGAEFTVVPDTSAWNSSLPRGTNLTSLMVITQGNLATPAQQLLIATLQGIVARQSSTQIYIDGGSGYSIWDEDLSANYRIPMTTVTSPWSILNQFKGLVSGYIRCNISGNTNSLNAATSLCGPFNAIAVDSSIESTVNSYGITNLIADVSSVNDQFVWTNVNPDYNALLSRNMVAEQKQSFYANLRDYATLANAYTFFEGNDSFRTSVMHAMNPGAACFGWGDASDGEDLFVGPDSSNGVVNIPSDYALDLSALSGVQVPSIYQSTYDIPAPQTNVNYVTFVMTDGDNVQENLGSDPAIYQSGYRGKFNFGWSLSASLANLAPSVLQWYYDNASNGPNRDFFVAGVSGLGYFYPSELPAADLGQQVGQINQFMTSADMDITQVLDFSSFTNAALWAQYLAEPNINALIYLDYSQYDKEGGAMYFSTNGKPILSCSDLIWGGLESPAQVIANINNAPRDPSSPSSYKLVEYHLNDSTYSNLSYVLEVVTNLSNYVQVVTPEEFQRLVVDNIGRKLSFDFASSAQGWTGNIATGSYNPYNQAYWTNTVGNPSGALVLNGSHLGKASTNMNSWFTRQIILPPNATTLSFDTLAVNDGLLQVQIQPAVGGLVTLLPWAGQSPANTWSALTTSLANYAGQAVTLYFEQMDGGQGNGEYRYVDNVEILTTGPAVYLPAAPRLLSISASDSVNIIWRANDTNETSFEIDRSLGQSGVWSQIGSGQAGSTTYTDTSVSGGTTYSYRVRSWNGAGSSPYSNIQSVTTPPRPVFSASLSATNILLAWPNWASNFTLYSTTNLAPPIAWIPVSTSPTNAGANLEVTLPVGPGGGCYFQLRNP
jgi:hypothetical protein